MDAWLYYQHEEHHNNKIRFQCWFYIAYLKRILVYGEKTKHL